MNHKILAEDFVNNLKKLNIRLDHVHFKTWEDGQEFAKNVKLESAGKIEAGVITINDVLFSWPAMKLKRHGKKRIK